MTKPKLNVPVEPIRPKLKSFTTVKSKSFKPNFPTTNINSEWNFTSPFGKSEEPILPERIVLKKNKDTYFNPLGLIGIGVGAGIIGSYLASELKNKDTKNAIKDSVSEDTELKNEKFSHNFQHIISHPANLLPLYNPVLLESKNNADCFNPRQGQGDLDSFVGMNEVIESLADVIIYLQSYLKEPDKFKKLGLDLPKGILLSGVPGVGKSYLAECIAGHAGVPIIMISGASFHRSLVGETEALIREMFVKAREAAPCVLCIDEIDAIASKRVENPSHGSDKFLNSTVDALLTHLAEENPGVLVVATTNHSDSLDPAVIREGRFDRHIKVPLPDLTGRKAILMHYLKDKKLNADVSVEELAKLIPNYSGAKIRLLVNQAASLAVLNKQNTLSASHFDKALTIITQGISKPISDPLQKNRTAHHEAGHALVAHLLNTPFNKISVGYSETAQGYTELLLDWAQKQSTREEMLNAICIMLAGRAGEIVLKEMTTGSSSDLQEAKQIAITLVEKEGMGKYLSGISNPAEIEMILQEQLKRAIDLIEANKEIWERVANTLVKQNELSYKDFLEVIHNKQKETSFFPFFKSSKEEVANNFKIALPPKKNFEPHNINFEPRNLNPRNINSESINIAVKTEGAHSKPNWTIPQIAKALEVNPDKIRKIDYLDNSGIKIVFKPSFKNEKDRVHMEKMAKKLHTFDVDCFYCSFDTSPGLDIKKDSYEDFDRFVKTCNANASNDLSDSTFAP